jgi:inhibitor of cysteine peptidase
MFSNYRRCGIAFLLPILSACASFSQSQNPMSSASLITASDKDNGGRVELARGDSLALRLVSQPGTGYGWAIARCDTAHLRLLEEKLEAKEGTENLEGAEEYQVFRFLALKADSSAVELRYVRPWKKEDPPVKTYRLTIGKSR